MFLIDYLLRINEFFIYDAHAAFGVFGCSRYPPNSKGSDTLLIPKLSNKFTLLLLYAFGVLLGSFITGFPGFLFLSDLTLK